WEGGGLRVVVHGEGGGEENLRRMLVDWLTDIGMIPSGHLALIDRYVGYLAPYATSHDDLDRDTAFQDDVRNAARALVQAVKDRRSGKLQPPDRGLHEARPTCGDTTGDLLRPDNSETALIVSWMKARSRLYGFLVEEIGRLDIGFFLAPRFVAFQDAQPGRQSGKQQRQGVFTREIGGVGQGSRAHRHDTDRHHQDQA